MNDVHVCACTIHVYVHAYTVYHVHVHVHVHGPCMLAECAHESIQSKRILIINKIIITIVVNFINAYTSWKSSIEVAGVKRSNRPII